MTTPESNEAERIQRALDCAFRWGEQDSDHHKKWVIDQMVRALTGCPWDEVRDSAKGESEEYRGWVAERKAPDEHGDTFEWNEGIAP